MTDMRVRQIALVAKELEPVLEQLDAVFGLKVGFRDPGDLGVGRGKSGRGGDIGGVQSHGRGGIHCDAAINDPAR